MWAMTFTSLVYSNLIRGGAPNHPITLVPQDKYVIKTLLLEPHIMCGECS